MAPTPIKCSLEGCEYSTPANCPDWDRMLKMLELHNAAAHNIAPVAGQGTASTPRLEKHPQPSFSLDMSQAEWSFKEAQWSAYINQSTVRKEVKVQQLQAACDQDLLRRVYDAGGLEALNTEGLLMAQLKKLAVKMVHKTLHMQNMWSMTQSPEEPIRAFCSRLVGTAELCDFTMTCSLATCTQKNSYRDRMVMQALLKGMHDSDIRTRVLSRTQNDELKDLTDIVDYIAAEEASSASFATLSNPHTIAANRSTYNKLKHTKPPGADPSPSTSKCSHCGGRHPGDSSQASRQAHCKAYGKKCTQCKKLYHYATVCKSGSKPPTSAASTVTAPPDQGPVTGAVLSDTAMFYAMQTTAPSTQADLVPYVAALKSEGPVTTIPLPHVVHSIHAGWMQSKAQASPTLPLEIKIDRAAYADLKLPASGLAGSSPSAHLQTLVHNSSQCPPASWALWV